MFAPSFGFALTNENHLNPCRDRRPRLSVVGKVTFVSKRTVRQLVARTPCPYNKWGDLVRRHNVCSRRLFSNGRFVNRPQRCSLYFSASTYVRTYQEPSPSLQKIPRNIFADIRGIFIICISFIRILILRGDMHRIECSHCFLNKLLKG